MRVWWALILLGHLGFVGTPSAFAGERPRSPFAINGSVTNEAGGLVLRFDFGIPADHVLYSDHLKFEIPPGESVEPGSIVPPVLAIDKNTGKEKQLYKEAFWARFPLGAAPALPLECLVKFQGCSNSACYFPEKRRFRVALDGVTEIRTPTAPMAVESPSDTRAIQANTAVVTNGWKAPADQFQVVARETGYLRSADFLSFLDRAQKGKSDDADPMGRFQKWGMAATLLFILLGGAGLNLTPCVLPLIPINLAIIGAGARAGSRQRGFLLGATYGLGMALAYGILGLVVVTTGAKFGTLNSSPWFNGAIALIFIVLGLGMFDVISIDLSRFRSGGAPGKAKGQGKGQFALAFLLGAMAALLAGACVAPVVISVLLLSAKWYAQGTVLGLALPFLLGLGMALPWPFAGAGLAFLPKPGRWMNWVKYGFGVLILAFSLYYLHLAYNLLLTRRATTELGNAPGRGGASGLGSNADARVNVSVDTVFQAALEAAVQSDKPVLIDFKASWCKNCVAMDETTFQFAEVKKRLGDFTVIPYQAEQPNEPPAKDVLDHFGVLGLPTYVVLSKKSSLSK